ncbi:hypothetical protein CPB84DRAFT_1791030 [Gymnopilus junonius]|uniref:Uncharacterized protein n=1 Tax=Gymnopilus junonius TaxID=109634 RepID=A0A9P5NGP2_GYMJU|nr:hypothetical protein CPB84DRAFT_1791030 [Gymnopilus junonius]
MLFRYVVLYFAFWNVSSLEVYISLNTFYITVLQVSDGIPSLEPHWSVGFRICLAFYPDFSPTCNSLTLLEPFLQSDLSNVKMLDLSLATSGGIRPWVDIGLLFKSFSPSVEVLRVQTTPVTLRSLARIAAA